MLFLAADATRPVSVAHNPSLVISEVYPVAAPSDSSIESHEWIEIHNPQPHAVNLGGWTVEDSQAISPLPEFSLPSQATVVVVGRSANIAVPSGNTLIILSSWLIGNGLRNAGDRVALVDPHGVRSDAVSWGEVRQPRFIDPPTPGQSIVRKPSGGQSLSDSPTPWETEETLNAEPERYRHAQPDTMVRITSALVDPLDDQPESVTLENISDQPLVTVNWTLTVDNALVKLRSVKIEPGEPYTLVEPDGKIGGGLAANGGHLVLRDPAGNWLATASWGDDHTFHRLPPPAPGQEVHFNPFVRVHPRVPWFGLFDQAEAWPIDDRPARPPLLPSEIVNATTRERAAGRILQESEEPGIWISEVHPTTGQGRDEAAFEWFELTNATDEPIPLNGWLIADNRATDPLDALVIPPRSTVVVGVSDQGDPSAIAAIVDGRIGNGLANAGDQLRLINADGEVVNAISWGSDRSHTSIKSPNEDESIHRASPSAAPTIGAPSPGTPPAPLPTSLPNPEPTKDPPATSAPADAKTGDQSPVEADDDPAAAPSTLEEATSQTMLQITEILPSPLPGEAEWIELFNPNDQPIDLTGWTIGDLSRRTPLSGVIPPRSYLIIANLDVESATPVLIVDRIGNGLNNDADTIALYDPSGEPQFTISYGANDVPVPGPGLSVALDPERWVVTAAASPGSEEVTPLLDDAFRSPTPRQPAPDDDRLPLVPEPPDEGLNAWMIVSFALIGVILTLIVRRWQPERDPAERSADGAQYSGPRPQASEQPEPERSGDNQHE